MNSEEYVSLLKKNVIRLKEDGDFLRQNHRNLMAIFCYVTMTEEFFKLAHYVDNKTIPKIKGHFTKLKEINEIFEKRVRVFKSDENKNKLAKTVLDSFHTSIDELIANTTDQTKINSLSEFKHKLNSPELTSEISSIFISTMEDLSLQLERLYSNRIRELCLYVDWNHPPFDNKEIEMVLNMYTGVTDGLIKTLETMV